MVFLIVAAFNEEASLADVIHSISRHLAGINHTTIIVNDGSTDRTRAIAEGLASESVILLNHGRNLGIRDVIRTGFGAAVRMSREGDIIVFMEGDNTSDVSCLAPMIAKVREGSDVVIGSRLAAGGGYRDFPFNRKLVSVLGNRLLKLLKGIPGVHDYTIFYRAYRAEVVAEAMRRHNGSLITRPGFASNCEFLIKVSKFCRGGISEVPLVYHYGMKKSKSKLKLMGTCAQYLRLLMQPA